MAANLVKILYEKEITENYKGSPPQKQKPFTPSVMLTNSEIKEMIEEYQKATKESRERYKKWFPKPA